MKITAFFSVLFVFSYRFFANRTSAGICAGQLSL